MTWSGCSRNIPSGGMSCAVLSSRTRSWSCRGPLSGLPKKSRHSPFFWSLHWPTAESRGRISTKFASPIWSPGENATRMARTVYIVVEVSWEVGVGDVQRASTRAGALERAGVTAIPKVAGESVIPDAEKARQALAGLADNRRIHHRPRLRRTDSFRISLGERNLSLSSGSCCNTLECKPWPATGYDGFNEEPQA